MLRDQLIVDHQSHLLQAADRGHFLMSILRRHRVIVAIEANQREGIGLGRFHPPRFKGRLWQRQQRRLLLS